VHANSRRSDKVFFAVDCGTLSSDLLASELFGHVKGAFTNAHKDKAGIFLQADGGTVFLDEIGNIDPEVQSKLLRFLESQEFLPIGGSAVQKVNLRLIFASNQELEQMVLAGRFRQDFYYRIFVYPILLPPLRERPEDILPIAYHFIHHFSQRMGKPVLGVSDAAASQLTRYDWPGNVRQLRNAIERAVIQCDGDMITQADLALNPHDNDLSRLIDQVPQSNDELKQLKKDIRNKAVDLIEKNFVLQALSRNRWNVSQAARSVGLQRSNLQKLIQKHAIQRPASLPPE
jgi:transcriptional regulator with GAF, ATPase, and Fis domain